MALGMTLNGAAGNTETAMRKTLGFESFSQSEINETYKSLIDLLAGADPNVIWTMANSIWYRNTFSVLSDFINVNRTYFYADVRSLDFSRADAPGVINGWISDKTNGLIKDMIKTIDPLTMMYLINAVYFKGMWTTAFDPAGTKNDLFNGLDGSTSCQMMGMENELAYSEASSCQIAELPYASGRFGMLVVLPNSSTSLDALVEGLTPEMLDGLTAALAMRKINLFLPKFKMQDNRNLNVALAALGMGVAFTDTADFSRINPDALKVGLYISNVLHKAYVSVDESGTEAAAVTVVEVGATSIHENPTIMRVDRPFLFLIRERSSGTILFAGKVNRISG
jgi:serpin B